MGIDEVISSTAMVLPIKLFLQGNYIQNSSPGITSKELHPSLIVYIKEVDKQRTKLKKYINQVNAYQKDKTANKNRIESIKQMPGNGYADLIKSIKRRIKITEDEITKLRNETNKIIKNYYKETYELLTSINGVGSVTASVIIAYFENLVILIRQKRR